MLNNQFSFIEFVIQPKRSNELTIHTSRSLATAN